MRSVLIPGDLIVDFAQGKVGPAAIALYSVLKQASDLGISVTQQELAIDLGLSIPSVKRHLAKLKDAGWVSAQRAKEVHGMNTYVVHDKPAVSVSD